MAQKNRISETEWKQLLPQMASFAHITTDIGYSVLWIPASLAETVLKEAAKYSINNITTSEMEKK